MEKQLKGKTAIITGAAGGIGSRIAIAFGNQGARLVLSGRNKDKLVSLAEELKSKNIEAIAVQADVTQPGQVKNMVAKTIDKFGRLEVLVNNAGGAMYVKPPEKLKPEEWNNAIALNLTSVFLCSQAASQRMISQKYGSIINISSVAGMRLSPAFVHYGAAKAGVINLTKSLAACWGPHNINVNCIAPGLTATEGVSKWLPNRNKEDGSTVPPLEYPPDPEHVAELATFLASKSSSHISGELFPIRALTELA